MSMGAAIRISMTGPFLAEPRYLKIHTKKKTHVFYVQSFFEEVYKLITLLLKSLIKVTPRQFVIIEQINHQ